MHKARTALRQIVGNEIPVVPHESGKHLVAKIGLDTEALMASGASEIFGVRGRDVLIPGGLNSPPREVSRGSPYSCMDARAPPSAAFAGARVALANTGSRVR